MVRGMVNMPANAIEAHFHQGRGEATRVTVHITGCFVAVPPRVPRNRRPDQDPLPIVFESYAVARLCTFVQKLCRASCVWRSPNDWAERDGQKRIMHTAYELL